MHEIFKVCRVYVFTYAKIFMLCTGCEEKCILYISSLFGSLCEYLIVSV